MNKYIKIISTLLTTILLVVMLSNTVMANAASIAAGLTGTSTSAVSQITSIANQIIGILTTIGIAIAVLVLIVLGIKYMMGSTSEKAEYKKTMIPYFVGAILVVAASAIAKVIISVGAGMK